MKTYKGKPIYVPWQKRPLFYTTPADRDDFHYFLRTWKTANRFLEMANGEGLLLSEHIRFLMNEHVRLGVGDLPWKDWTPWTKEKEKQRKKEMERIANVKVEDAEEKNPQEPIDEFNRFAKKQLEEKYTPRKLDTGFRVFRLVDENGNTESGIAKIAEREEREIMLPGEPPRLSRKQKHELFELVLRIKYDKEFRAEFEESNKIKVVNI